jgi:hypothetical protein
VKYWNSSEIISVSRDLHHGVSYWAIYLTSYSVSRSGRQSVHYIVISITIIIIIIIITINYTKYSRPLFPLHSRLLNGPPASLQLTLSSLLLQT